MAPTGWEGLADVFMNIGSQYRATKESRYAQQKDLEKLRMQLLAQAEEARKNRDFEKAQSLQEQAAELARQREGQTFRVEEEIPALEKAGAFNQASVTVFNQELNEAKKLHRANLRSLTGELATELETFLDNDNALFRKFSEKYGPKTPYNLKIGSTEFQQLVDDTNKTLRYNWTRTAAANYYAQEYIAGRLSAYMAGQPAVLSGEEVKQDVLKDFFSDYEFPGADQFLDTDGTEGGKLSIEGTILEPPVEGLKKSWEGIKESGLKSWEAFRKSLEGLWKTR